ncbi:MAG: ribonuclease H-like domain-containing protein [Deferribacteres bacterium]|nr:ribonuclease H-like domain-containing protein [candidate division KSB1 bacterium]MCB9501543.1 ribonuclease H-like domain-containing protein [Deferribacteres bacterium]
MNIKEKLRNLHKTTPFVSSSQIATSERFNQIAAALEGELLHTEKGSIIRVTSKVGYSEKMQDATLHETRKIKGQSAAILSKKKVDHGFSFESALFIDTETTGLSGSSGTYAFLVGIGYFKENNFCVEQLFMPGLGHESALLSYLEGLISNSTGIVTFNGKSYDIPLLTARFIQNRMRPTIDLLQHFDVLHAARRIWKNDFGNCSLINLEQNLLQIHREGDIPGEEIPAIYRDYLRSFETDQLSKVIYHNKMDIITMATLIGVLNATIDEHHPQFPLQNHLSMRVVNLFQSTNESQKAIERIQALLEQDQLNKQEKSEHYYNLGMLHKRAQNWESAEKSWLASLNEGLFSIPPAIELAKYYEHKVKDLKKALNLTTRCMEFITIRSELGKKFDEELVFGLKKRKSRLELKINKGIVDD